MATVFMVVIIATVMVTVAALVRIIWRLPRVFIRPRRRRRGLTRMMWVVVSWRGALVLKLVLMVANVNVATYQEKSLKRLQWCTSCSNDLYLRMGSNWRQITPCCSVPAVRVAPSSVR